MKKTILTNIFALMIFTFMSIIGCKKAWLLDLSNGKKTDVYRYGFGYRVRVIRAFNEP